MPINLTLLGPDPKPLPVDVQLTSESITNDWDHVEFSENGLTKFRRKPGQRPIRIGLMQNLGLDQTLFQLADRASFGLKVTYTVDTQSDGGTIQEVALLDVDLNDLVPDDFVVGPTLVLYLITKTRPKLGFPSQSASPATASVSALSGGNG